MPQVLRHGRRPGFGLAAVLFLSLSLLIAPALPGQERSFLWKATGRQGSLYLVGSIHMLTRDFYPLSAALTAAFEESDLLVEELDLGVAMAPASQLAMLKAGMMPSGQSLERAVSADTLALVTKQADALGLPLEPLKRFKPWSLALTLLGMAWQKAGFDGELGLDRHFYDRARLQGKAVQGLETVEFQISRFDEMSASEQERMLRQALREIEQETPAAQTLANAWRAGDADTIARIVLADLADDPTMYRRLIVERNQAWLPTLVTLASRPRPAFVVVGAAHLVGPDGLLAALRNRGFTLTQR
jgi:uncharacterized protein YbaP (TraB family)